MFRKALADWMSPMVFFTTHSYSPRSLIRVGSMLRLPSGPTIDRDFRSCSSTIGWPSLNQFTNDESCTLVTQWKKAVFPSIIVWLIGGIRISEPPSTDKWNHVPLLRKLGVRLGNMTRHSYQPESDSRIDDKFTDAFPKLESCGIKFIRPVYKSMAVRTPS